MVIKDLLSSEQLSNIDFKVIKEILMVLNKWSANDFSINNTIENKKLDLFFEYINQFKQGIPLEYITKKKYFYESEFYVDDRVLIPRVETEMLVEEALNFTKSGNLVIDVCCGSGCIGLSLKKKFRNIELWLSDISSSALEVAKYNSEILNIEANLINSDFLDFIFELQLTPDIILMNPPYIKKGDVNVAHSVSKFEPHLALFAVNDGLYFYQKLFDLLDNLYKINKNLIIISEFGFQQKNGIEKLFKHKVVKYKIDFKKDYFNNWRYFVISK
ncbi:peptide chain release factor N(5)-glutamine methyltransferase [Spiroplasma apis]|uniref:peptide chain release factor N(5)-glutamine methyltransferase n=1 Tax=Spiroplasma apis B31 TaxID=1276258 RepID=V5RJQ6_SPIAP|nr:peptide chain release factor N(5)-glutamine methyltransferase [Spiroplasma apis]AHB36804.1 N5-glutamine S-adenosyl-L-methionine-dependent methyltransferase [Spiroplasma apis B31]